MKTNIERIIIIGDELSQSFQESAENEYTEISLDDDNDKKITESYSSKSEESLAEINVKPQIECYKTLAWYDYLLDDMIYKLNQLTSSIYPLHPRNEIYSFNLEHYQKKYVHEQITIQSKPETQIDGKKLSRKSSSDLVKVSTDIIRHEYPRATKESTLIFLWLGIHDLKQNNTHHEKIVDEEELANKLFMQIKRLTENGYCNFCVLSAVNTHLTSKKESTLSFFNMALTLERDELKRQSPNINIDIIDTQTILEFAEESIDLNMRLTSKAQKLIAETITNEVIIPKYNFVVPEEILIAKYRKSYQKKWQTDKMGIMGFLVKDPGINYQSATLSEVFEHAKNDSKSRTFRVLKDLGWIDEKGNCISFHPIIQEKWLNSTNTLDLKSSS